MKVLENRGNNIDNKSVSAIAKLKTIGPNNYREGVEDNSMHIDVGGNCNTIECNRERDVFEEFFTQYEELKDEVGIWDNRANDEMRMMMTLITKKWKRRKQIAKTTMTSTMLWMTSSQFWSCSTTKTQNSKSDQCILVDLIACSLTFNLHCPIGFVKKNNFFEPYLYKLAMVDGFVGFVLSCKFGYVQKSKRTNSFQRNKMSLPHHQVPM